MITHKLVLALVALTLPASSADAGTWKRLPAAPISPEFNARSSVWTGKEMLVFGRDQQTALDANGHPYATGALNVAAAYNPSTNAWRKLSPPTKTSGFMGLSSVWTGKEMLVWGQGTHLAYNPRTDRWRQLPSSRLLSVHDGFGTVVWSGREAIGWGGGCCGDAFSDGVAYNPASNSWRALPRAPLPGSQHPLSAWTGKELVVVLGKRAAAYSPARNTWRRIAAPPTHNGNATALWDGHEIVIAGASRSAFAYSLGKNRWRRLPTLPAGRAGKVVVSDGNRLIVWGGSRGGAELVRGAAKWTALAHGPLPGSIEPTAVWTGTSLIIWGGLPTKTWGKYDEAGALFTPPVLQSCGDGWMAENLRVTQAVKAGLRAAYVTAHPGADVGAPAAGHTYYGRYSGVRYAVARFASLPTIFRTDRRNNWRVREDTRGAVCSTVVPVELLKAWSLRPVSRSCYALPS